MIAWNGQNCLAAIIVIFTWFAVSQNTLTQANSSAKDIMKAITNRCIAEYSLICFKLDLLTVIERLNSKTDYHLTSGITLTRIPIEDEKYDELPRKLVMDLARDNFTDDTSLDVHLFHKIGNFLRSIHLSFPLVNDFFLQKMSRFLGVGSIQDDVLNVTTGRKKLKARWVRWLISVVYALAFGLLAGLVSKSLLLSLIALCLTLVARFGNRNFDFVGGGAMRNNYEIIAHPVPQVQHMNTHSSEIKYEDDPTHSSSHPGVAYVYPRTIPHIEKVLAFHHLANLHKNLYSEQSNADTLAYKGYITEANGK